MNIAYAYGATRFVVLCGPFAFKFARIPWIRFFRRACFWYTQGEVLSRPRELYGSLLNGIFQYLLCGIISNLGERQFFQAHPDLPLAPTLFSLFGVVNIQTRGNPIAMKELRDCPFQNIAQSIPTLDLASPRQFCRINGNIVLADYGHRKLREELRQRTSSDMIFA